MKRVPNTRISMARICFFFVLIVMSLAWWPLLLVSVPATAWYALRLARRVRYLRACRDAYLETVDLQNHARFWR